MVGAIVFVEKEAMDMVEYHVLEDEGCSQDEDCMVLHTHLVRFDAENVGELTHPSDSCREGVLLECVEIVKKDSLSPLS